MIQRLCAALVLAASLSFVGAHAQQGGGVHLATPQSLNLNGVERSYRMYVPQTSPLTAKLPLVLVFHGGGGDGRSMEGLTRFSPLARRERFIVVYPDGIGKNWNDGREDVRAEAFRASVDDVGFVQALVGDISKRHSVDEKRIYATGISNGAIFSHYLAAQWSEKIAAIAPVVGGIADPFHARFSPKEAVSVFILQGTADPLTPYDGGAIARGGRGKIVSTDEAIRLWAGANGISGAPEKTRLPDNDTTDNCSVESYLWPSGKNGSAIQLYKQIGAGHTWPGGIPYMPARIIGQVCRDFDATEAIWNFFKTHAKR